MGKWPSCLLALSRLPPPLEYQNEHKKHLTTTSLPKSEHFVTNLSGEESITTVESAFSISITYAW